MEMKRNVTSILTVAAATMLLLTSCGVGTSETAAASTENTTTVTAEEQLTVSETTAQSAEETTTTIITTTNTAEQETEVISETGAEIVSGEVVPPDSEFLLKMFDMWHSDEVLENGKELAGYGMGGSPAGSCHAFYADIDGDGIKEFCFIVDSYHGLGMYVCDYVDGNWKVVDALALGYYTYLKPNDDGTTSLFVIKATRYVEEIYWYIYNGVEEEFDFLDIDKLYDELDKIDGMNEQEEFFHAEIEKNLERFDDLTNIYDLPHVDTVMLYDSWGLIHEDLRIPSFDEETVRKQLDEFTAEVAELFEQD